MRNPSFKETTFKVGRTQRDPVVRAKELSRPSGVPSEFEVVHSVFVSDCGKVERHLHERLLGYRINENREFFAAPIELLVSYLNDVIDELERQ